MTGCDVGVRWGRRARSALFTLVVTAALAPAALVAMAPSAGAQIVPLAPPEVTQLLFAEGNTLPGWHEFITILNPNTTGTATVSIKYACEQPAGTPVPCGITGDTVTRTVSPLTRDTVSVFDATQGGVNGVFTGVGATLTSNLPVIAERPMYMAQPAGAFSQIPAVLNGAHDARAQRPSPVWLMAEGTTQPEFQMYLTLLNPQTDTVTATIVYSVEGGGPALKTRLLPPGSRTTIDVVDPNSPGSLGSKVVGVSTIVSSNRPIVVERPLYFDHNFGGGVGQVNGATDKPGAVRTVQAPAFLSFAEGNGLPDFEQFFTILNVDLTPGIVTINYLVEGQTAPVTKSCAIGALARATINVSAISSVGAYQACSLGRENAGTSTAKGVGATITSDRRIVAERPTYFNRSFPDIGLTNGAHDVFGVAIPAEQSSTYYFAEGSSRTGFDQFWTISNPSLTDDVTVAVDYLFQPGAAPATGNTTKYYPVPRASRKTVQVWNPAEDGVGRNGDAGFDFGARAYTVDANKVPNGELFGIERPFYTRRNISGQATDDAHDIPGASLQEVFGTAQLTLQKTSFPTVVASAQDEITFTLTARANAVDSLNTVLTDVLPIGTTFKRASDAPLVVTATTPSIVRFNLGTIPAGSAVSNTIVVTATIGAGGITNTAVARSSNGGLALATSRVVAGSLLFAPEMNGPKDVTAGGSSTALGETTVTISPETGAVCYVVTLTGMTQTAVAGHIHTGAAGVAGAVLVPFTVLPTGAGGNGTASGCVVTTPAIAASILASPSLFYVNLHTPTFPGGALRDQLQASFPAFAHSLNGANEAPTPNSSGAGGSVTFTITPSFGAFSTGQVCFTLTTTGMLTDTATAAHIHRGALGVPGPVIVPLSPVPVTPDGTSTGCVSGASTGTTLLTQIIADPPGYYANVHTGDFPGGVTRDQLSGT